MSAPLKPETPMALRLLRQTDPVLAYVEVQERLAEAGHEVTLGYLRCLVNYRKRDQGEEMPKRPHGHTLNARRGLAREYMARGPRGPRAASSCSKLRDLLQ